MSTPVRPELDESTLSDADLWEAKVAAGMPKDSATAYVRQRPPRGDFSDVTGGSASAPALSHGAQAARAEGTPGKTISFLAGANQGGTFGFADEVGAAATSLVTGHPIKNYQTNLDYLRERFKMANEANPKTMLAGEFAGAVASPASRALGAGEGALSFGGRVAQGAKIGALGGAVAGAGNADGGLADRAKGAAIGGTLGAGIGGTLPIAGAVGGVAGDVRGIRRYSADAVGGAAGATAPRLAARAGAGGLAGGARTGAVDFSPLARGAAGAVNRFGPRPTSEIADELLLRAARDAGEVAQETGVPLISPADAVASGQPLTPLEIFGEPARRLGQASRGVSRKASGTIENALTARHGGQTERVLGAVEGGLGQQRGNIFETADEIVQRRGANAATEYQQAYQSPPIDPTVKVDPKAGEGSATLLDLFKRPSMQKAFARARMIASEEGEDLPPLTRTVEVNGKEVAQPVPVSVKTLHYVKLALDDMLYGAKRGQGVLGEESGGTGPTALAKVQQTRRALLDVMDREAPEYGAARANFAGETALKDALESGREALSKKTDPRLIQREFGELSDSEQEMYRKGAIDALQQRMEAAGSGANKVLRVFDSPADKARLRALFPDEDSFRAFEQQMEGETQMAVTRNRLLGNSNTAEKLGAQKELEDNAMSAIAQSASNPRAALLRAGLNALDNRRRVQTRAVADALAPRLTAGATPSSGSLMELLNGLTEAERRIARRNAQRRAVAVASGATVGSSAGGP